MSLIEEAIDFGGNFDLFGCHTLRGCLFIGVDFGDIFELI
jgi:hypothetical protein